MNTFLLSAKRRLAMPLVLCAAALLASCNMGSTSPVPTPSATIPLPTATPNIALSAPHIVAAWLSPVQGGPCEGICSTLSFTSSGPFVVLISCDGYQQYSGSLPTVDFTLFDANGHQADAFHRTCGDPNQDTVTSFDVPESFPAGGYQLVMNDFPWECSVTIIEAAS